MISEGDALADGIIGPRDPVAAEERYTKAGVIGAPLGYFLASSLYRSGKLGNQSLDKEVELREKAAAAFKIGMESGQKFTPRENYAISILLTEGSIALGINKDLSSFYLRTAAEGGEIKAMSIYGSNIFYENVNPELQQRGAEYLCNAMNSGNIMTIMQFPEYMNYVNVDSTVYMMMNKCFESFKKTVFDSDHLNDPKKTRMAAWMHLFGVGVEKNQATAIKLFRRSAQLGNIDSMVELGDLYSEGLDKKENEANAIQFYRMAADQGDLKAADLLRRFRTK